MNQEQFLYKLGLNPEEFHDLVVKFDGFLNQLSETQKKTVHGMMPTMTDAARSWGPDVTPASLTDILEELLLPFGDVFTSGCSKVAFLATNLRRTSEEHRSSSAAPKQPEE